MKYIINMNLKTPAYIQLYNQIKKDIVRGIYPLKSKLPSKRTMALETGLSIITIEHAYALLLDEGYIESYERSGFFVIFSKADVFLSSDEKIIKHNNNLDNILSDFPISVFKKTMRKVMNDYGENIFTKSNNLGCSELREAIKLYLARNRGIEVQLDQIIIGSGSEYLYNLIVMLLGKNRIFAIEYPSYHKIEQVYRTMGVNLEFLNLGSNGIESSQLNKTNANVLHVSPYRSFPTGITASASKKYEYIRWSKKENNFIIEDDFESEFSISNKPEETIFTLSEYDNVIYLNTFSKTISPSLRVGYMVLPKCLVNKFINELGFYSCTVPTFEQYVLAELISNGDFERHINRVRRQKRKEMFSNIKNI
ncbi:PLP-dependent aminotransferase family protein [Brachyspira intermedia]|uniref:MocR-like pyridoxine biosynthesis transcription factor PdxR n=1 Tax=Brachyspira intermedia TaxID=84377 RepID=UPI003005D8BA